MNKWSKYVTRRLAVQIAQAWNFGWGKTMAKVYGVSVTDTLIYRDKKKTDYYVDEKQHTEYIQGLYRLLQDKNFLKTFHKGARHTLEQILYQSRREFKRDLGLLSNKELVQLYIDFVLPTTTQFYIRMWTVFNIGEPLAHVVRIQLERMLGQEKVNEYLLHLSSPLHPNDVLKERMNLLRLRLSQRSLDERDFYKKLRSHTRLYRHIPMFDFDHEPFTEAHFLNELKNIKNPQQELLRLEKHFAETKDQLIKLIKRLKPDKDFKKLIIFLKENVFLRDHRDMVRQKFNLELKKFYSEIAKRLSLSVAQVATLTNKEITKYLLLNKSFPLAEVKRRDEAFVLIQRGSTYSIYSGKQATLKARVELSLNRIKKTVEIKGVVGSGGKTKGIVKIVYSNRDLGKIKKGDILVTPMTRQDFISAIRKAGAIVADEGSVTAHASIIARELNKPCIVATRIGTQVLKDGDFVEVDANRGIVKILKRAK